MIWVLVYIVMAVFFFIIEKGQRQILKEESKQADRIYWNKLNPNKDE